MDTLLSPCGIDCGICSGYLRTKNRCLGCLVKAEGNLNHIASCSKKQCTANHQVTYCFECPSFPCYNLKKLEKRYATQYGESPIYQGIFVREHGLEAFRALQLQKWNCVRCGEGLNVHKSICPHCEEKNPNYLK